MRTLNMAWSALRVVSLSLVVLQPSAAQTPERHSVDRLLSPDPAVRGVAKAELIEHPDPAVLPQLLAFLPSSSGTIRENIFEVLDKYDDPRKIPIFLSILKPFHWDNNAYFIGQQLARLGAPAAQALMDSMPADCPERGEDYPTWARSALQYAAALPVLLRALPSDNNCKHQVAHDVLMATFGDEGRNGLENDDLQLASDAAVDTDDRIRAAAKAWLDSLQGKEDADFSGIVEALITAYRSNAPPETMLKVAEMLSETERPRVTRFMRAAVKAPDPEIQRIANQYLSRYAPHPEVRAARPTSHPRSPEEKIKFLSELSSSPQGDVNRKIVPYLGDPAANVRAAATSALGSLNAHSNDVRQEREADPATALPGIRKALEDPSPLVRSAAAEALGEIRSYDDREFLVAVLKDSDASVVLSAMAALEEMPSDSAVPVLTELYRNERNSAELRRQAVSTLGATCNPDSIPIFLEILRTSDNPPQQVAAGLECALKKRPEKSASEPILKALQTQTPSAQNWYLEASLIHALGETKNPQAFEPLAGLLKSPGFEMRRRAVEGLGLLGDHRAIPLLAGLLKDPDNDVRTAAAFALTQFSDFSAPPELIAALRSEDTVLQIHIPTALVQSHDPKAIDALIAAMPTHPAAIYALGESHDPRAVPALIAFLQNPINKSQDRSIVAESLGKLGDARAIDPLIASLSEDNGAITMKASYALATLKDKRAIEPLKQAYSRWSTGQRENAESVKGSIVQALLALGATDVIKAMTGTQR
jgi:HEAT repeat protein